MIELVVTMTLVAILGTIATIYVFDSFGKSRDGARITSFSQIEKNMGLFKVNLWRYPEPDNFVSVTFSGAELWKQWEFGAGVSQTLWVYGSEYPQDPLYEHNYTYSTTNDSNEYQIWTIIEDTQSALESEIAWLIVPQAHAGVVTAYVRGDYNGFLTRAIVGSDHNFITTPSIIASDLQDTDIIDIINNERLVFDEFFNLPSTYKNSIDTFWWFYFFPENPLIHSGSLAELQNRDTLIGFIDEMKFIYSSSQIATFPEYQALIEWDTYTSTKKILETTFGVPFAAHSCNDILANWEWLADGFYVVDSDEWEDGSVYCDMTTWNGWWTRVWVDYITNWEFQNNEHIPSETDSNPSYVIKNLWTENTPVVSPYALHQTGNSRSEYEVRFDKVDEKNVPPQLQPGYEIRMSLWLRDDDNWVTWEWCNLSPCRHNPYAGYVFHNRLYYLDWTTEVNGVVEVLDTQTTADGKEWKLQRVRKKVRKIPTNFRWYIWYGAELNTDLYFTGVKLEIFYK